MNTVFNFTLYFDSIHINEQKFVKFCSMKFKPLYILKHHYHPLCVHVDSLKRLIKKSVQKGDNPIRFLVHL
jgi:hypothetical protein